MLSGGYTLPNASKVKKTMENLFNLKNSSSVKVNSTLAVGANLNTSS